MTAWIRKVLCRAALIQHDWWHVPGSTLAGHTTWRCRNCGELWAAAPAREAGE